MNNFREGIAYLVVRPGRYPFDLTVDKATNNKPRATTEGSIVLKLQLRVPRRAFEPLEPQAVVTVPDSLIPDEPIDVEAVDLDQNRIHDAIGVGMPDEPGHQHLAADGTWQPCGDEAACAAEAGEYS